MNIVADANMTDVKRIFSPLGEVSLVDGRGLQAADLVNADVLLVRSVTQVDQALLEGSSLRFVGTATSGIDHVDTRLLRALGIPFAHAPGSNANSVVEYVINVISRIGDHLERLMAGGSVGIIGFGRIGRALERRLSSLGATVCAYDPWLDATDSTLCKLDRVLQSEVICIHAELTERQPWPSRHLLGADLLSTIGPDSLLLNAGRGAVIDNAALLCRLQEADAPAVVLDVWEWEPHINLNVLNAVCLGTPHIAGYSLDGKIAATEMLYAAACDALQQPARSTPAAIAEVTLQPPTHLLGPDLVRWLYACVYNPFDDDAQLRDGCSPGHFDALRRDYPQRRELASARVLLDSVASAQASVCAALGCKVESAV